MRPAHGMRARIVYNPDFRTIVTKSKLHNTESSSFRSISICIYLCLLCGSFIFISQMANNKKIEITNRVDILYISTRIPKDHIEPISGDSPTVNQRVLWNIIVPITFKILLNFLYGKFSLQEKVNGFVGKVLPLLQDIHKETG